MKLNGTWMAIIVVLGIVLIGTVVLGGLTAPKEREGIGCIRDPRDSTWNCVQGTHAPG